MSIIIFFKISYTDVIRWIMSLNAYEKILTKSNRTYVEKQSNITEHHLTHTLQNIVALANLANSHMLNQDDLEQWLGLIKKVFIRFL